METIFYLKILAVPKIKLIKFSKQVERRKKSSQLRFYVRHPA